jgi:hypothetical protein
LLIRFLSLRSPVLNGSNGNYKKAARVETAHLYFNGKRRNPDDEAQKACSGGPAASSGRHKAQRAKKRLLSRAFVAACSCSA